MANPSPIEFFAPGGQSPMRKHWWSFPPSDETTRKRQARHYLARSPYALGVCLVIVVIGSFYRSLAGWQILLLAFCGVLDAKIQLRDFLGTGSKNPFLRGPVLVFIAPVMMTASPGNAPFLVSMGTLWYAMAWVGGTENLLLWLFRESFLRHVETPNPLATSRDLNAKGEAKLASDGSSPPEFDY